MPDSNPTLDVQVTSTVNIFPEAINGPPKSVPLSIIDNTVANLARCAAIWYYDPPTKPSRPEDPISRFSPEHLQTSLSITLNSYPQFCGHLSYATPDLHGGHTQRYHRIHLSYNKPNSSSIPVPFLTATTSKRLSHFIPSIEDRETYQKAWNTSEFASRELVPSTPLALSKEGLPADTPNMVVQYTTFACGSTALAISITHCLSDAQSLSTFAKYWSLTSRALLALQTLPKLSPIFNPKLLDDHAAGMIDSYMPNNDIRVQARRLPMHRYDWYTPVPNQPWPLQNPSDYPQDIPERLDTPSKPIPWHQWNTKAPVLHYVLHFSKEQVQTIFNRVSSSSQNKFSKHDGLLSHVWNRINTARQHAPGTQTYLNLSLGLRQRLPPPLPANFLGSPITSTAISHKIPNSSKAFPSSYLAEKINREVAKFTPKAVSQLLHDEAFEVDPQRLWRSCLGKEHLLVTSWIYLGVQDVDFVGNWTGGKLRYVEPVMSACDGLIVILEGMGEARGNWTENGVDVSLFLEEEAMKRLLGDEELWGRA